MYRVERILYMYCQAVKWRYLKTLFRKLQETIEKYIFQKYVLQFQITCTSYLKAKLNNSALSAKVKVLGKVLRSGPGLQWCIIYITAVVHT
jgi:hypothetical protein